MRACVPCRYGCTPQARLRALLAEQLRAPTATVGNTRALTKGTAAAAVQQAKQEMSNVPDRMTILQGRSGRRTVNPGSRH